MERSTFFKPLVKTNAFLTLIQSITWFILSIICFLYYSEAVTVEIVTEVTYKTALNTALYELYLRQDFTMDATFFNITPKELMVFASFYFVLSIILINASILSLYSTRNINDKQISFWQYCSFITWVLVSLFQSLLDLIFFCLLIDDYNYFASKEIKDVGLLPTAIGVAMVIVARGFILWVVNLVLNVVTMLMIVRAYRKDREYKKEIFPPMERRSTLRRSTMLSDELRPYQLTGRAPMLAITARSNDSYVSDRYDPALPPQAIHRPPPVARFNPPVQQGPAMNRYDNGYGGMDQPYNGPTGGGLRRSGSGFYGGR